MRELRALARAVCLLVLLINPGCGHRPSPPPPPVVTPDPAVAPAADAAEVARLVGVRRGSSLPPNARLSAAAQAHADDMARRGYFHHVTPEGTSHDDRARRAGYPGPVGEVIANGYPSPAAVVDGWMRSPGHRRILMAPQAVAIGSGVAGPYRVALVGMAGGVRAAIDLSPPGMVGP